MTDRSNKTLTPEALAIRSKGLELLARAKGLLEGLSESADVREDRRVYIGDTVAELNRDIEAFLWMDKPVGVPPIAPEMLTKIMGDDA